MKTPKDQTVLDYFNKVYLSDRKFNGSNLWKFQQSARWLSKMIGHDVTIGELTEDLIAKFRKWIPKQGYSTRTKEHFCSALGRLRKDFCGCPPPVWQDGEGMESPKDQTALESPKDQTALEYFEDVFRISGSGV